MTTPKEVCQEYSPEVLQALRENLHSWTILSISRCNLGDNDDEHLRLRLDELTSALWNNTILTNLYLEENQLTNVHTLCQLLRVNQTLTVLDLGSNLIDNAGAEELALALQENTTLAELYLNNNVIGEKGGKALLDTLLHRNKTLSVLDLGGNPISNELHREFDTVERLQKKRTGWTNQPAFPVTSISA